MLDTMDITQPGAISPARPADLAGKWIVWPALGALLVLAACLRLHAISIAGIWIDESTSWNEAIQSFPAMIWLTASDVHPPLYNSILYLFVHLFGDSETVMRLPSAIMGVAAVGVTFWAASLIGGRAVGLVAAAFLCLSGFHIDWSQTARNYSMLSLTSTFFAGTIFRALETDRRGWHVASCAGAVLLLYSHVYGGLLWLSLVIAVTVSSKVWRDPSPKTLARWATGQRIAALLFLPWALILVLHYGQMVTDGFWISRPTLDDLLGMITDAASGGIAALALLMGAAVALAPRRWFTAGDNAPGAAANHETLCRVILATWLLAPLLIGLALSLISQPILVARYLIGSLPAWLILAALGFCLIGRMGGRWGLTAAVGMALAGAVATLSFYQPMQHEDTRGVAKAYLDQAQAGDCVFVLRSGVHVELDYYLRPPPRCYFATEAAQEVAPWAAPSSRSWLFLGFARPEQVSALTQSLKSHGWRARPVTSGPTLNLLALEPAS